MPEFSDLSGTTADFLVGGNLTTLGNILTRIAALTDAATVTPNVNAANVFVLNSLSQDTTIANPTGSPINYQELTFRISSTISRRLMWGSLYASTNDLPSRTTGYGKEDYFFFRYNNLDIKWDLINTSQGSDRVNTAASLFLSSNFV